MAEPFPQLPCPPYRGVYTEGKPASDIVEMDIGCGKRRYRWTMDGKDPPTFEWECEDQGQWYKLIGKKRFHEVLDMIHSKDGRDWGDAHKPSAYSKYNVRVWQRSPTNAKSSVNELMFEGDFPNVRPEEFFNCLHEEAYRATWDARMVKGYNIARFTRNNDIGYYEATMPWVSNRDFCNQRGWAELGKEHYIICNNSSPHPGAPTKKGTVRAKSWITAYYFRPSHIDPTGTCITYVTCTDPGGMIPSMVINKITSSYGPEGLVNLYKATQGLPAFLQKSYESSQANGGEPLKGPWDKTLAKPSEYTPREPTGKGSYRTPSNPLELEARQLHDLKKERDEAHTALLKEELEAVLQLSDDCGGVHGHLLGRSGAAPPRARARSTSRGPAGRVDALKQQYENEDGQSPASAAGAVARNGDAGASSSSPAAAAGPPARGMEQMEDALGRVEDDNRRLRERLAVFSRTAGADPLTRVPADEKPTCSEFRRKVSAITEGVALEIEEAGMLDSMTTEDYLSSVLAKLEEDYPLPVQQVLQTCPSGHANIPYDQLWKVVEYRDMPLPADVCIAFFGLFTLIASTAANVVGAVYAFMNNLWAVGILAIVYIIVGDWTLWWCLRDTSYKERPIRLGGRALPLLWPTRLQLCPILPLFAVMLMFRVPKEMTNPSLGATHANVIFRFTFLFCFLRVLFHNGPLMYIWAVVEYKTNQIEDDPLKDGGFFSYTMFLIILLHNVVFPFWMLLWMAKMFCCVPSPTTSQNVCGLPPFRRWLPLSLGAIVLLGILGGISVPIIWNDDTFEKVWSPVAAP